MSKTKGRTTICGNCNIIFRMSGKGTCPYCGRKTRVPTVFELRPKTERFYGRHDSEPKALSMVTVKEPAVKQSYHPSMTLRVSKRHSGAKHAHHVTTVPKPSTETLEEQIALLKK